MGRSYPTSLRGTERSERPELAAFDLFALPPGVIARQIDVLLDHGLERIDTREEIVRRNVESGRLLPQTDTNCLPQDCLAEESTEETI